MKKNILIIGFPLYALLDFYKNKLENYGSDYNFYIITDNIGITNEYFNELSFLKRSKKIIDFYIIPVSKDKIAFKYFYKINSYFIAKKIFLNLENINFSKIFCTSYIKPEIRFILNKLNNIYSPEIFSISISNFALYDGITFSFFSFNNFKILIKKIFQLRTNIRMALKFIENFLLSILSFFIIREIIYLGNRKYFALHYKKKYTLVSSKDFEIDSYLNKFNNLNIVYLSENFDCKCLNSVQYNKKLLIVLEQTENKKKYTNFIVENYFENVLLLNKKYKFCSVDIKPHPRDYTLTSNILMKKLINININTNVLGKNVFLNDKYCQYSSILGGVSSTMLSSLNQCKDIICFGILKVVNLTCIDPKPKNVTGDFKNFKSGIIWIEDIPNFINLSFEDLFLLSKVIKSKKFTQNYQFRSFKELLEL